MNIEWLKNKAKEKFYPITHAKAVLFGENNRTVNDEIDELKNDLSNLKDGTTPAAKAVADEDGNNIKSTYVKKTEVPSGSIVDSELSETSVNPVQNKVVTAKLNEVFQSVSNGKSLIASAITDKGITTAADATFQVMVDNIGKISVSGSAEVSNPLSMIGNYNFQSKIVLADELSADNIAITKDSTNIQITSVEKTDDTKFKVTGDFSAISVGDVIKVQTNPGFFFDSNLRSISDVSVVLNDSRFKIDNPGLASTIKLGDCITGYYAYSAKQPTDDYWAIGMFAKTQGFIVVIVVSTISEYAYAVTSNYITTPSGEPSSLVYDDGKTYYFNTGIRGAKPTGFDTITNNIVPIYKVDDSKFTNNVQGWTYMAKKLLDFYFGKEEFPQ